MRQGMNELLAPIYYLLRSDTSESLTADRPASASAPSHHAQTPPLRPRDSAESDAFYLFVTLMGEVRDCFTRELDDTTGGIRALLQRLGNAVSAIDPELGTHLYGRLKVCVVL